MPAESAAAPDASGASESNNGTQAADASTERGGYSAEEQAPSVGSRAHDLLTEMGVSDEVQELVNPKENANADKEKAATEDKPPDESDPPEKAGGGHQETGKDGSRKSRKGPTDPRDGAEIDKAKGVDEDQPLTEQEKKAWPAEALARIGKATAQKHAAKTAAEEARRLATTAAEETRQLREQLQTVSRVRVSPTQQSPLADIGSMQELQRASQHYEELLAFAELNPDGLADVVVGKNADGTPAKRDFSAQEMAEIRATSGRILRQAVPARQVYLQEQQQEDQFARTIMPEIFDPKTDEYKQLQQALHIIPGLTNVPGFRKFVALAIIGQQKVAAEVAAHTAKTNGANGDASHRDAATENPKIAPFLMNHPPQAPSVPSTRGGGTTAAPSKDSERKKSVEQFADEGGGDEALENLLERQRTAQTRPARDAAMV